jgi:hypothetical protein
MNDLLYYVRLACDSLWPSNPSLATDLYLRCCGNSELYIDAVEAGYDIEVGHDWEWFKKRCEKYAPQTHKDLIESTKGRIDELSLKIDAMNEEIQCVTNERDVAIVELKTHQRLLQGLEKVLKEAENAARPSTT